jgi:4-alpha-glucanotransferase
MKVCQFAFDGSEEAMHHVPHGVPKTSVAYTGTHDNNTTRGWFQDIAKKAAAGTNQMKAELSRIETYLDAKQATISWDLIRATMASQASLTVFPMQDLLSQTAKDRMNVPGLAKGNWKYRVEKDLLTKSLAEHLAQTTSAFGRG